MPRTIEPDTAPRGNRWRPLIWGAAGCLLLLPLAAMQFTHEVDWTLSDFVVMGAMLAIACGTYELGAWISGNTVYRAAFGIAVLASFLLMWVNLAVGVIGSENNPANLMYAGVLAVGAIGALVARFQPGGMSRALLATALAQLVVGAIALAAFDAELRVIVGVSAMFAVLWLASAGLFRMAARDQRGMRAVG
jgi:hypothetical protein